MKKQLKNQLIVAICCLSLCACDQVETPNPDTNSNQFPCEINGDYNLINKNPNGVDYVIDCMVNVNSGAFVIAPGVEIEFKVGSGIVIHENAHILALGNDSTPILFNGTSNSPCWNGIVVESNDPRNQMEFCRINAAGNENISSTTITGFSYSIKSALTVFGKLKTKKCVITNSGGIGLFVDQGASNVITDSLNFENCVNYPIYSYCGLVSDMKLETNSFKNNSKNFIGIFSTTSNQEVSEEVSIKKTSIPYLATHNLDFTKNVSLAAGVTIYVNADKGISINQDAQLSINGTIQNPVVLRGLDSLAGFWKGLYIGSNLQNQIDYLTISNGGSSTFYACPKSNILIGNEVTEAKLTINNSNSVNFDGTCQLGVEKEYSNGQLINNSPKITNICEY